MTKKQKIKRIAIAFAILISPLMLRASIDDPTTPDVTLVTNDGTNRPYFPSITKLPNGHLIMTYYWNTSHVNSTGGSILVKESSDNGANWTLLKTINHTSENLDSRDAHVTLLSNGTLVLNFFTTKLADTDAQVHRIETRVIIGTLDSSYGISWSDEILVPTNKDYNATSGAIIELDRNGNLLIPTYGKINDGFSRITVSESSDWGLTWDSTEVTINTDGVAQDETSLVNMGNGTIFAVSRPGTGYDSTRIYKTTNYGQDWEQYDLVTNYTMHAPDILRLDEQRVFLTWCNNTSTSSPRPVYGKIFYPFLGWSYSTENLLYNPSSASHDMGYPSSVLLNDARLLTVYYSNSVGAIMGTYYDISPKISSTLTFDNESSPIDFNVTGEGATISSSQHSSGDHSLRLYDQSASVLTNAVRVTSATTTKEVEFKIFPVAAPNGICFGLSCAGNTNNYAIFHMGINSNGRLKWYNGSSWQDDLNSAGNVTFNTWNTIRIYAISVSSADIYVNGVYSGTIHNWNSGYTSMDRVRFMSGSTAGTGDLYYIDDVNINEIDETISTFESETVGAVPLGYTIIGASALISNEQSTSGSKSIKLIDESSSILTNTVKVGAASSTKELEFKIYPVSSAFGICFGLSSGGNTNAYAVFHFIINSQGHLLWYNGAWNDNLTSAGNITFNQWNVIHIKALSVDTALVYINGIYAGYAENWGTGFTTMDRIRFMSGSTAGIGDQYYIDDVIFDDSFKSAESDIEDEVIEPPFSDFSVYPNPTENYTVLNNYNSDIIDVNLFSIEGKLLKSMKSEETQIKIDLSEYNSGLYFLSVKSKSKEKTYKILKD